MRSLSAAEYTNPSTSPFFSDTAMNVQQPADIPALASMFTEEWPDDDSTDADYPAPPTSVDFPDADSDSASESEESDDSGVEEGYILGLYQYTS
jgi:hypothetical protein